MSNAEFINPHPFGDLQSSSFIPASTRLLGEQIWPTADKTIPTLGVPLNLALAGDLLVVRYADFIQILRAADGSEVLKTEIMPFVDFQIDSAGVLVVEPSGLAQWVSLAGKRSEVIHLPYLGERTRLHWATSAGPELRYAYTASPIPGHGSHAANIPGTICYGRALPKTEEVIFVFQRQGVGRGVCTSPDFGTVVLGSDSLLDVIPADVAGYDRGREIKTGELRSFSINAENQILVVDKDDDGLRLRALGLEGNDIWTFRLEGEQTLNQPPASSPGGNVWLVWGRELLHFHNGLKKWNFSVPAAGSPLLTVLDGGLSLLAVDSNLTLVGPDGQMLRNRPLRSRLTCRPIVDASGRIYVGGPNGIFCVR